jgi:Flp pilus assembly protein CpaB
VAQIHASTLFAVILAIVAGLIFAWVFKMVFLNGKPKPVSSPPQRRLTVAATNLLDRMLILPGQVKTITVSEEEYNAIVNDPKNRSRVMLSGMQPVNRTTLKAIRAEEPVYEDQLEPLAYPEPVSSRLREGKRAVLIEVPAGSVMIQVGDHVDVYCTLENENMAFGASGSMTAAVAKGLRVIARFGTTRTAAMPPSGGTWSYTVEASPYRASIINLCRSVGGSIKLYVSPRQTGEDGSSIQVADTSLEDPQTDRVTVEDLAKIFGIQPPAPTPIWTVERYTGVQPAGAYQFHNYVNGPANGQNGKNGNTATNGTNGFYGLPGSHSQNGVNGGLNGNNKAGGPILNVPGADAKPKINITPTTGSPSSMRFPGRMTPSRVLATAPMASVRSSSKATAANNFGFRPLGSSQQKCCGKK